MISRWCWLSLAALAATTLSGQPFPKPEPEKAFAELKIYDAAGRPWRVAREDWDGARKRVADDPAWRGWLAEERAAVEEWMAHRRDRVEWVCGWWHDFVSPKDGSHLTWTPAVPGEEVRFLSSPSDPHVEITPKLFGGWVFEFRVHHTEMIERAARLFRLSGDERYAAWVAGQLDFYAAHYLEWPAQRDGARLCFQTLDEATFGTRLTAAARLLGDYVAPARKAAWRTGYFEPMVRILDASFLRIHNIATWQRCASAQVALLYDDETMWRHALDSEFGLRRQLADGVTSDYLWWEQSLHYNNYLVSGALTLFTAAGLYGRADELAHEMAVTENLMLSPVYLRFPDSHLPNPADGTGRPVTPNLETFAATYRVFPTAIGLAAVAGRRDWNTLLDPPPPAPPVQLPDVTPRNLESTRMALLEGGPWQVFVHYGQLTQSHSQAEALNYSAFFRDTDVTHDAGTVGYGSPLHEGYYTRGPSHNVPLVNGEGQEPPQLGDLVSFSPTRVVVAQPNYRHDARASETVAIEGGKLVVATTIESTAAAPQKLGLALQIQGRVRLPASFVADERFAEGRPAAFGFWRETTAADFRDRASFEVDFGTQVLRLTIAVPGGFRLWHGDTPDSPPARRESLYLETTGERATFTVTWEPVPSQ